MPSRFSVPNSRFAFIGLNQRNGTEEFGWIDDTELTYDAWVNNNLSSSGGAECVGINSNNEWEPVDCQKRRPALCSKGTSYKFPYKVIQIPLKRFRGTYNANTLRSDNLLSIYEYNLALVLTNY